MNCNDCPRYCNVDRNKDKGFCGGSNKIVIAKVIENFMWEEPCITGEKGTLAIFFAGCNLKCCYCQNYKISHEVKGDCYSPEEFAIFLKSFKLENFSALEFITPTHYSSLLIEVFKSFKSPISVVWNSGGYETVEKIKEVSSFVDVFIPDFKYSDDKLAIELSSAPKYFKIATNAIKQMVKEKGENQFENGELKKGVLIRHLVLPGHVGNSINVLKAIKKEILHPFVSIMSQFVPIKNNQILKRTILPLEYKIVLSYAEKLNLNNGYIQEFSSASQNYIPNF